MRIEEIAKVKSDIKERMRKIEFNLLEILMGNTKNNKTAQTLQSMQPNSAYNISLSSPSPRTPKWDVFWTKREPAMTDEEFEKEISALALEFAEKSTEIGNSGKGKATINSMLDKLRNEYNDKRANLELQYVSVVSPDRKAAYAKADFRKGNVVYGSDGKGLLEWSSSGWVTIPTAAENERVYKFADIYRKTLTAYEKEHGQIPYTTISKTVAPRRNYL